MKEYNQMCGKCKKATIHINSKCQVCKAENDKIAKALNDIDFNKFSYKIKYKIALILKAELNQPNKKRNNHERK